MYPRRAAIGEQNTERGIQAMSPVPRSVFRELRSAFRITPLFPPITGGRSGAGWINLGPT